MSTKIPAHRIKEGAIGKEHLSPGMRFNETSELTLNYPTHSNLNDLNRDQYLSLTQLGFADHLHKHTGGGGGDSGIYTNKQRDAMLMDLMMLIASQAYRLENSLMDDLSDSDGIYLGVAPPKVRTISEQTSQVFIPSLEPSIQYSYCMSQKIGSKLTNASMPVSFTTSNLVTAPYRRLQLMITMDERNDGIRIWRAKSNLTGLDIPINAYSKLDSPDRMLNFRVMPETTAEASTSLAIEYIGAGGITMDMASSVNGAVLLSKALGISYVVPLGEEVIFGFRNANATYAIHELGLSFGDNPAEIPLDFKLEYSTSVMPDATIQDGWLPLECKYKFNTLFTGALVGGRITNNTSRLLTLSFDKLQTTGIRLTITRHLGGARINTFAATHRTYNVGDIIVHTLDDASFNMNNVNSLMVDIKSDEDHFKYGIGFKDLNAAVGSEITDQQTNYNSVTSTSSTQGVSAGRHMRTTVPISPAMTAGNNKIKLTFGNSFGWNTEITDVTVALTTTSATGQSSHPITLPETLTTVTFGNGSLVGRVNASNLIESDWIDIPYTASVPVSFVVTLRLLVGNIYVHNVSSYYIGYKDNVPNAQWSVASDWNNLQTHYTFAMKVETAKGYSSISFPSIPVNNQKAWYRHCVSLAGIKSRFPKLEQMLYMIKTASLNGQVKFSNLRFSNAEKITDTLRGTLVVTAAGTNVAFGWNATLSNYWESANIPTIIAPEYFMIKLPSEMLIDMLRFIETDGGNYIFEQYIVQYTTDNTALYNDPETSPKWSNITSLDYILEQKTSPLKGTLTFGLVTDNKITNEYITHKFTPTSMRAIRIVFKKTRGNTKIRLRNVELFSAEVRPDYEIVYDSNEKEDVDFEFIDGTGSGTVSPLLLVNETGSSNIVYDSTLELIRVYNKSLPAVFLSKTINTDFFSKILLRCQVIDPNDSMHYFVSNDNGGTFTEVELGDVVQLPGIGNEFVLKIEMEDTDILSAYSMLFTL